MFETAMEYELSVGAAVNVDLIDGRSRLGILNALDNHGIVLINIDGASGWQKSAYIPWTAIAYISAREKPTR